MDYKQLTDTINQSSLCRMDGQDIDVCHVLTELANAIHSMPDHVDWEYGNCWCVADIIVGSYWAMSEWHVGQYSDSYAALSALGQVYRPGCANGPEKDSGAMDVYVMVSEWMATNAKKENTK